MSVHIFSLELVGWLLIQKAPVNQQILKNNPYLSYSNGEVRFQSSTGIENLLNTQCDRPSKPKSNILLGYF